MVALERRAQGTVKKGNDYGCLEKYRGGIHRRCDRGSDGAGVHKLALCAVLDGLERNSVEHGARAEFGRSGSRSAVDRKYRGDRWPLGRSFRLDTRVEAARHDDHPRRYPRLDWPRSDRVIFNRAVSGSQVVAFARWQRQRDRADTLHRSRLWGRCCLALRSVQLRASAVSLSHRTILIGDAATTPAIDIRRR